MEGLQEVVPGVYGMGDGVVNWYLVDDGGRLTAIDAGLPPFAETLEEDLATIGHRLDDIEALVLTHSDGDHVGLAPFLQARGVPVYIHSADDPALRKPGPKGGDASVPRLLANAWRPSLLKIAGHLVRHGGAKPVRVEGAQTFGDDEVLDVPGRLRTVHTPGHTVGHCALLLEDRGVIFVGDALITHPYVTSAGIPRVMPSYFNFSTETCLASLTAIEHTGAEVVAVGHGEPWREGAAEAVARARAQASRD